MKKSINRRRFLKSSTGLLALAALDLSNLRCTGLHESSISAPTLAPRAPRGPNERINVAIIGLGGRSQGHLSAYTTQNNCLITHVCDPDTAKAPQALDRARQSNGGVDAKFVTDLRRILDDPAIDAVSIVAPNHWHALATLWALQAGKDVCVEKPLSHSFREGSMIVDAVNRSNRVCQVGTQMRANPALIDSMAYLHEGNLGKVLISRALCYKPRITIGKVTGPQQPPATVDYDLWCGPAPLAPILRTRFHYDWHWIWDFGNGDIGNQGVHEIDIARWAINADALPVSVQSIGGRFGYVDDGQTANTQTALVNYGPSYPPLIVEVRGLETKPFHSKGVENVVECEKGFLVNPTYTSAIAYDRDGNILKSFNGGSDQNLFNNFISVMRSRKTSDLLVPAIQGHYSAAPMHLANISYRLGKQVPLASASRDLLGATPFAQDAIQRTIQHLSDNKLPMDSTTLSHGPLLMLDGKSATIKNNPQANAMLMREYRKPFTV